MKHWPCFLSNQGTTDTNSELCWQSISIREKKKKEKEKEAVPGMSWLNSLQTCAKFAAKLQWRKDCMYA